MSYRIKISQKRKIFARLLGEIHDQLYQAFTKRAEEDGLTKTGLAKKLGVHKSLITRKFNGTSNLSIRTLAEMAWAMEHHPEFKLTPMKTIGGNKTTFDHYFKTETAENVIVQPDNNKIELSTKPRMIHSFQVSRS